MANRFILQFNSNLGKVIRISLPRACTVKNATEAQNSMNAIIANGMVSVSNKGTPASIKSVERVSTVRETLIG
ncbi:MAG: DUF2922 domain-containing protein [Defluviitaleaceae bacterium]|nr:DUF2922 domain-containing protein [Defluviitaleaceae bacterium]